MQTSQDKLDIQLTSIHYKQQLLQALVTKSNLNHVGIQYVTTALKRVENEIDILLKILGEHNE